MKRINVRFEEDPSLDAVEVLVRAPAWDDEVSALMERIDGKTREQMIVTDADGARQILPLSEIVLISVNGKLTQIVTEGNRFTVRTPLQSVEERLKTRRFVRISRYEIVNLDKVKKFDFTLNGTLRLELSGGMETWASRRNIPQIRKKLMERK